MAKTQNTSSGTQIIPATSVLGNLSLDAFIEHMPDVFYRVSISDDPLTATVDFVSPQGARLTGISEKEFKRDPSLWIQSIHPDDLASLRESTEAILESREVGRRSFRIHNRKTKEYRWIEDLVTPIQDDKGKLLGYQGVARDMTDHVRVQRALLESEERYRIIFDQGPDALVIVDAKGTILEVNNPILNATGYSSDEITGKNFSQLGFLQSSDLNRFEELLQIVLRGKEVPPLVVSYTHRSGDHRWAEIRVARYLGSGADSKFLVVARDITARKSTEEALVQQESHFRSIFEHSPVGIGVARSDGTLLAYNEAMLRPGGYTAEDIRMLKNVAALYYDTAERDNVLAIFSHDGHLHEHPIRFRRKDGTPYHTLLSLTPILFEGDQCILALVQDVSDQRAVDDRLLRLQQAVDSSDEIVFITETDGTITYINPAFTKTYQYSSEEVIGKTTPRILKSGLLERAFYVSFWTTLQNHEIFRGEITNKAKDGSYVIVDASANPILDAEGKTLGYLAIQRNINDRKQAEEALRHSEEKYRSLFEESRDAILLTSPAGKITDINRPGLELLGYNDIQEIRELDISHDFYVDPRQRESFKKTMERQGYVENLESDIRRRDGTIVTIQETTTSVRDANGNISGYRAIMRDMTHQRGLEQQLRQAQKMESLGTLAGGIAHDFNNILGIILAHSSHIPKIKSNEQRFDQSLQAIQQATQRGAGLVRQLLTFARKSEIKNALVDVNSLIAEITKLIKETFPRTITLDMDLAKNLPPLFGDPSQLHQVILNLCVNARDAMPQGGVLTVETSFTSAETFVTGTGDKAPATVHVRISDTGTGMDATIRDRIFEPFFTTKEAGKGTGLGLALVYGIVNSHKGFVTVDSEPGRGTRFDLYFPVPEEKTTDTTLLEEEDAALERGTEKILIVEDEEMLRDLLQSILSGMGYTVFVAQDGEQAIDLFTGRKEDVDLIVTDLGLPKIGGEEVVRRIFAIDPEAKVLVASGYIEPDVRKRLKTLGVSNIIQKPYRPHELLTAIRDCLD